MAEAAGDMKLGIAALVLVFLVFGVLAFVVLRMGAVAEEDEAEPKQKGQRKRGGAAAEDDALEDEDGDGNMEDAGPRRRNAAKDEKRKEKQETQNAERQMRQQRDKALAEKQKLYDQKQQAKDAAIEKQEAAKKKAGDDKEKQEQEEFGKWKEMFDVEATTSETRFSPAEQERFVEYIRVRKAVPLEDLAAEFQQRTAYVTEQLKELERQGRINGIFDDRGQFVYITNDEMEAIAECMKSKGRISRADLLEACNRLVRLNPTKEDQAKLQQDALRKTEAPTRRIAD